MTGHSLKRIFSRQDLIKLIVPLIVELMLTLLVGMIDSVMRWRLGIGILTRHRLTAEAKTYQEAVSAIDGSLKTMGLDYIDMMLIHSPQPWAEFREEDWYVEGNSSTPKKREWS